MKKILILFFLLSTLALAQTNGVVWKTVQIDSAGTVSDSLDIRGDNLKLVGVWIDSTSWTSANLTIDSKNAKTSTWANLQDEDGTDYTITIGAMTEPIHVFLKPADLAGVEFLRFVSSAAQNGDAITIYVLLRPY